MRHWPVEEYVALHGRHLKRAATLLTGDSYAAEDLCQDTLARMVTAWPRIRSPDAAHSYALTTMARLYRRQQKRRWLAETPTACLPEQSLPSPDVAESVTLRACLAQLPPGQRAVLVLRYYGDLTVAETAKALHCSQGNVKSQSSRGLARLQDLWDSAEPSRSQP